MIKYLRRTTCGAAGNDLSRYRGILMCPFTTSTLYSLLLFCACLRRQQSEWHCRGPGFKWPVFVWGGGELARCVHKRAENGSMSRQAKIAICIPPSLCDVTQSTCPSDPAFESAVCVARVVVARDLQIFSWQAKCGLVMVARAYQRSRRFMDNRPGSDGFSEYLWGFCPLPEKRFALRRSASVSPYK
jgi:hypothetical protein